ncbi:MAG: tripartite tricarboxylate transporter substrate binding protein [Burkholderiales bacterium]
MRIELVRWLPLIGMLAIAAGIASAQEKYPAKPIQMITPQSPGTATDIVARMFAEKMAARLGQSVVVQNRPGAGATIGTGLAAKAAPDGYTILMTNSAHTINPSLYNNLPFDTLRDFAGLALVTEAPAIVVVNPQVGVRTLQELVALAKQKPGAINYGSAGVGTATHLAGAYFASKAGIDLVHVPYKVSADITTDLLTNRIQVNFVPAAFQLAHIREGKLIAIGASTPTRMQAPFEAPSISEEIIPGYAYATWYGFLAPAKTPPPILKQLAAALWAAGEHAEVKEKLASQGMIGRTLLLREFDVYLKSDLEKLAPIVKASGAKAN